MRVHRAALVLLLAGGLALVRPAGAQDPGLPYPGTAEAADTRPGAILVYALFTSSAADPDAEDTRFALTNTSPVEPAFVRLFFVTGSTGSVVSHTVCLAASQTAAFRASELRPGVTGFVVAFAVDGVTGCPLGANVLGGRADVRVASGFRGTLAALGVPALSGGVLPGCDGNSPTATVSLNGVQYGRMARVLQLPDLPSPEDQRTLVVLNRMGGNLLVGTSSIGAVVGVLYDDAGSAAPFSGAFGGPQLRTEVSDAFPSTAPPLSTVLPAGRTGWLKISSASDIALAGAALALVPDPAGPADPSVRPPRPGPAARPALVEPPAAPLLTGAVNLTPVSLTVDTFLVPVLPPSC